MSDDRGVGEHVERLGCQRAERWWRQLRDAPIIRTRTPPPRWPAGRRAADAEEHLNELLRLSRAAPHVHTTNMGMPWFLHFHAADAHPANAWSAGCAVGLAYLLSVRQVVRLGNCAADACDRVFLDLTKNRSRRFCSTACQNRVKAANHRKRQAQHDH